MAFDDFILRVKLSYSSAFSSELFSSEVFPDSDVIIYSLSSSSTTFYSSFGLPAPKSDLSRVFSVLSCYTASLSASILTAANSAVVSEASISPLSSCSTVS